MPPDGPVEIELKLLLPRQGRAAIEAHLALNGAGAPDVRDERTAYFDTPAFGLASKGLSLRVRRSGEKRIQTLKSAANGHGVAMARGEWEWPVAQDAPDLSRVAETPFGAEVEAEARAGLLAVVETEIRRTVRSLSLPGGTTAEAAFDEGRVRAGNRAEDLSELELELKHGAPGPLYRLALDLHRLVPFTIGAESKAQRGRRLSTGEAPRPVDSDPPPLDAGVSVAAAARHIVGAELGHLLANQPAAAMGEIEGVHQMRVGIRRLRTVLALFRKQLEPHAAKRFGAELKRLGQVFGAARDWDVFCTETLAAAEQDAAAKGWAALLRAPAETERRAAHRAVEDELGQPALTALVLGMAAWAEPDEIGAVAMARDELGRPLAKAAPALLQRMSKRVGRLGRHAGRRSAPELHALRKSLKKLRYSVDYLGALYPPKQVRHHQKAAKRLLKLLGAANDATVAASLADGLCQGRPELIPAAGALAKWSEAQRDRAERKLPKAWDAFAAAASSWR